MILPRLPRLLATNTTLPSYNPLGGIPSRGYIGKCHVCSKLGRQGRQKSDSPERHKTATLWGFWRVGRVFRQGGAFRNRHACPAEKRPPACPTTEPGTRLPVAANLRTGLPAQSADAKPFHVSYMPPCFGSIGNPETVQNIGG